jgi:hypothetical protein
MMSPDSRVRTWLGIFRRRPVVLSSPHPVSECLQKLEKVTTFRGPTTRYLDSRTVGRPEPLFRGQVYPSQIKLARFTAEAGRDSFYAMLDVRPEPGADGGTVLSGRIGLPYGGHVVFAAFAAVIGLVSLGLLVAGVAQLALGHLIGLASALAFPLPVIAWAGCRQSLADLGWVCMPAARDPSSAQWRFARSPHRYRWSLWHLSALGHRAERDRRARPGASAVRSS